MWHLSEMELAMSLDDDPSVGPTRPHEHARTGPRHLRVQGRVYGPEGPTRPGPSVSRVLVVVGGAVFLVALVAFGAALLAA